MTTQKILRCNRCGCSHVRWEQTQAGKWYLAVKFNAETPEGRAYANSARKRPHTCRPADPNPHRCSCGTLIAPKDREIPGRTGRDQIIELGDQVRVRRDGRVGIAVQVLREVVFLRFEGSTRHVQMDRRDVDSVPFLTALAEVDEDERNARAYRDAMDREYAVTGWNLELRNAERDQEARAFLSDPDYLRCGHEECDMEPCSKVCPDCGGRGVGCCVNADIPLPGVER